MNFDELFTKWKSEYSFNAFIRDGIVDPAHYDRPHILFILRDMNCRHERDLCVCGSPQRWKRMENMEQHRQMDKSPAGR